MAADAAAPTPANQGSASAAGAEFTDEDLQQDPLGNGDLLREREQKRSGGEGGGSANILVRGIKCSVAFACSFLLRNHWRLLQHLDRRSHAEQSKIADCSKSRLI
eukprot:COSAG04_NODE_474_length_13783_cov_18.185691_12_plen_105_part_00